MFELKVVTPCGNVFLLMYRFYSYFCKLFLILKLDVHIYGKI